MVNNQIYKICVACVIGIPSHLELSKATGTVL